MILLTASAFAATAVYVWLAAYALTRRVQSPLTTPFTLLCVFFAMSSWMLALVGIAPDAAQADFWFRLATPFSSMVPSASLHMLLATAGRPATGRRWKVPLMYLPSLPPIWQETLGPAATRVVLAPSPGGWLLDFGGPGAPYAIYYGLWTVASLVAGYGVVLLWGLRASTRREKRQARVLLLIGVVSGVGLAIGHGLYAGFVGGTPPAMPVPGLIVAVGFAWAIFRHRLMAVTPSLALDQVLASLRDMLLLVDPQGRVLQANSVAARMLARPGENLEGQPLDRFAADPSGLRAALEAMRDASPPGPCVEVELVTREVGPLPAAVSGSAIRNDDGDPIALAVVVRDLRDTQRLRSEIEERRRAEERLGATLRAVADGIVAVDVAGRVCLMNPVAELLAGRTEADAIGRPLDEVLPMRDARTQVRVPDPLARAAPPSESEVAADFLVGPEHDRRLATCVATAVQNPDGTQAGFVLVLRDVTVRRRIEEELLKASKLESVGLLAGGIAHDFNNLLMAMLGYIEMAGLELPEGSAPRRKLAEAEAAGRRARELTQKLLTFARGGSPVLRSTDVAGVIAECASLFAGLKSARCEVHVAPGTWPALADDGQLYQALNNLLLNAHQAMPGGGVVTVRADNVEAAEPFEDAGVAIPAGRWVRISVQDRGVGIAPQDLRRVFDPFFTTRPDGTGLGLPTTYSIVRRHSGRLAIESEPGRGTTLRMYVPAAGVPAEPPVRQAPRVARAVAGCRVLVMDDHPEVLGVAREMLAAIGCNPHVCSDGAVAVEAWREALSAGPRFDTAILDCVVPGGMGGAQAAREILEMDPSARLIISSGYADQPVLADYRAHGFVGVLRKPYHLDALGRAVEEALGHVPERTEGPVSTFD